jgi:heme-degrading monooxygenase HmoA
MIVRIWRGRTSDGNADAYQTHVTATVFPKLEALAGYAGGRVLRRLDGKDVEFLVVTEWESWDAIGAFAGPEPQRAVIEPEARAIVHQADEYVQHFEMAYESGRPETTGRRGAGLI